MTSLDKIILDIMADSQNQLFTKAGIEPLLRHFKTARINIVGQAQVFVLRSHVSTGMILLVITCETGLGWIVRLFMNLVILQLFLWISIFRAPVSQVTSLHVEDLRRNGMIES